MLRVFVELIFIFFIFFTKVVCLKSVKWNSLGQNEACFIAGFRNWHSWNCQKRIILMHWWPLSNWTKCCLGFKSNYLSNPSLHLWVYRFHLSGVELIISHYEVPLLWCTGWSSFSSLLLINLHNDLNNCTGSPVQDLQESCKSVCL